MKYMLMLLMALGFVLPGSAGEREEALLKGFFGLGAQVLDTQTGNSASPAAAPQAPASGSAALPAPPAMFQMFLDPIKQSVDNLINEYKEEYKEEGRAYAREVGDIVVNCVVQDPEINSTITSLRALCWVVIAYLTLVTLIMLGCLVYLRNANARLLEEVKKLTRQ